MSPQKNPRFALHLGVLELGFELRQRLASGHESPLRQLHLAVFVVPSFFGPFVVTPKQIDTDRQIKILVK
jgi:hypothetical protein